MSQMAQVSTDPGTLVAELLTKAPSTVSSPYAHYRALREAAPKYRMETPQGVGWVLTTYDECRAALRNTSLDKSAQRPKLGDERGEGRARTLLFLDGDPHTRLRGLASRAFTPRRVEKLKPRLEVFVDRLIQDLIARRDENGEVDLVTAFAFPLPVMVIGELVGVPEADWPLLRRLTRTASSGLEMFAPPEVLKVADGALAEMEEYFVGLVEERRKEPKDDLISALGAVEIDGDRLSTDELIRLIVLLFGAGFQTMTDLIGLGTLALCENRDQMRLLKEDMSLIPSGVEELLRYDSPVHVLGRAAFEDTAFLDGTPIAAGEHVITLIGAANRDPAKYENPEQLNVRRFQGEGAPEVPLSFAWGPHHCLGAQLARAEGYIAFERLLSTFSDIEIAGDELSWRLSSTFRGVESLPVKLTLA